MHEETIQDDILFDRLVDGDLSAAERRQLLESLDTRPDGWRRCALAFLEAQSWRDDLGQFVRESSHERCAVESVSASPAVADRRMLKHGLSWLAIAAGLLIAFTLGLMRREDGRQVVDMPHDAGDQVWRILGHPTSQSPDATATRVDDALTLWARDDTGQPRSLRVPLVDAGTLDRQFGVEFQSGLPADVPLPASRPRLQRRVQTPLRAPVAGKRPPDDRARRRYKDRAGKPERLLRVPRLNRQERQGVKEDEKPKCIVLATFANLAVNSFLLEALNHNHSQ